MRIRRRTPLAHTALPLCRDGFALPLLNRSSAALFLHRIAIYLSLPLLLPSWLRCSLLHSPSRFSLHATPTHPPSSARPLPIDVSAVSSTPKPSPWIVAGTRGATGAFPSHPRTRVRFPSLYSLVHSSAPAERGKGDTEADGHTGHTGANNSRHPPQC